MRVARNPSMSTCLDLDCLRFLRFGRFRHLRPFGSFHDLRRLGRSACLGRSPCFLLFQLHLVDKLSLIDPGLHLVGLLEAVLKGVIAWFVARAVQTSHSMSLFAPKIGTPFTNPRDHTAATEAIAAVALLETTPLRFEKRVAVRTGFEGHVSGLLCTSMNGVHSGTILRASLFRVLWAITVGTRLVAAIFAGEDAAVFLAIEGLEEAGAAVHANEADLGLFGISEYGNVRKSSGYFQPLVHPTCTRSLCGRAVQSARRLTSKRRTCT